MSAAVAVSVFGAAHVLIASEKINRVAAALGGAHRGPIRLAVQRLSPQSFPVVVIIMVVLALVLAGFVLHSALHLEPSVVALTGAGPLVLLSGSPGCSRRSWTTSPTSPR